jgi:hypothetical protein
MKVQEAENTGRITMKMEHVGNRNQSRSLDQQVKLHQESQRLHNPMAVPTAPPWLRVLRMEEEVWWRLRLGLAPLPLPRMWMVTWSWVPMGRRSCPAASHYVAKTALHLCRHCRFIMIMYIVVWALIVLFGAAGLGRQALSDRVKRVC